MQYKFYKCSDPFVIDNSARIVEIARQAFLSIPAEDVLKRIAKYDEILLVLNPKARGAKDYIIGFNFCSLHYNGSALIMGGRLVAVHPDHKGKGYLRTASLHLLTRYYTLLLKNVFKGKSKKLYIFSRQCNPIAYCLLHMGQEIYPDLVKKSKAENAFSEEILNQYRFLKKELSLDNLDVNSGLILNGAVDAGIKPRSNRVGQDWLTPWQDYVPAGAELITIIPISLGFPIKCAHQILKRVVKSISPL